jgi:SRSO17 transposase
MWKSLVHADSGVEFAIQSQQQALQAYLDGIGKILSYPERKASFAMYVMGLLSDGERKSVEPIAARAAGGDPALCEKLHDRMCHLLHGSRWDDHAVRLYSARYALSELTREEPIETWIIDDTGFLKQGRSSPGVQRQYTGSAGKITNCQLAVSLTLATRTQHVPVDMDLYLPESWLEDRKRCAAAHIPESLHFRPKWRIALDMVDKALEANLPRGIATADAWYGTAAAFRGGLTARRIPYLLDVDATKVLATLGESVSSSSGEVMSLRALAESLPERAYRAVTWREGTGGEQSSRFARVEVCLAQPDPDEPDEQTLLIEWPVGDKDPAHCTLSTLPKRTSVHELVRLTKQRWRTERVYEDMKGELGLDHFEGRTYPGWHHHVTAVLACYAFVTTALRRSFPPSARETHCSRPLHRPTRASLRRFLHHDATRAGAGNPPVDASLPLLSSTSYANRYAKSFVPPKRTGAALR